MAVVCLLGAAPGAHAALSLSVSTPLSPLLLKPGATATSATVLAVTPDLLNPNWALSIADTTGNDGKLARGTGTCAGVEARTVNRLTVRATGTVPTTTSTGTKTVSAITAPLASGNTVDALTLTYSLAVEPNELLSTACTMQTTITYTLQ